MQKLQAQIPLYIYLHTHWDREWFLPFSTARALLLDRVRKTLSALESGELPNFYLDGQAVVLEDLIEIEPELGDRIKNAMKRGRLSAGPWYVLPDQSLVGGESLIRNLKLGIEITRRFGKPTMTGYNPDTFCHVQDLPRILRGFAIDSALVLRGVPPLGDTNVFWWISPDGSRVLTYLLNKGLTHPVFHKTADAQEIADDLSSRWDLNTVDDTKAPMLYSSGGEGMQPPGDLMPKLEKVNSLLPERCQAKIVSMDEFIVDLKQWAKRKTLPEVTGDLRDNRSINERFPAYVLDGVSSTRLYLKRENALAEQRLIRITEPLFALFHTIGIMSYPEAELTYLWKLLIQNHPHDSICGCSIDPVHQEMRTRTQQLNSFLDGLDLIALERLSEWKPTVVADQVNGPRARVKDPALPAVAELEPTDPDNAYNRLLLYNTSCYPQRAPAWMTWYCHPETTVSSSSTRIQIDSDTIETNHLFHSGAGFYYKPVRCIKGWVWPGQEVPAMGCSEQAWGDLLDKSSQPNRANAEPVVTADAQLLRSQGTPEISNGLIQAKVDNDGNLVVRNLVSSKAPEFKLGHHFWDVGDGGDSYNFDPLLNDAPIKAELVEIKDGKSGPLVSSLVLLYKITIPEGLDTASMDPGQLAKGRAPSLVSHSIETEISLKKGVPILFFQTVFENRSRDHRLSVRFQLGQSVKQSWSECHFSLAKRPEIKESPQLPVPVGREILPESYFCQRFFTTSGHAFFNRGLPEYRVKDDYAEITLLRAVSYLSRGRLRTRGGGAGPWEATPEANCFGLSRCDYAWAFPGDSNDGELSDEQIAQTYQLADLFEGRLIAYLVGKFEGARDQSFIEISNPALYITATYIDKDKLYLRILNITRSPQKGSVKIFLPVSSPGKVNFLGEDRQSLMSKKEHSGATAIELDFSANELLTIAFELIQ